MKDFLVLPFKSSLDELQIFSKDRWNDFPREEFKIYTKNGELLPFICPFNGSLSYSVKVYNIHGTLLLEVDKTQFKHKILKKNNERYIVFSGGAFPCIDFDCDVPLYLDIDGKISETFYVFEGSGYTKISFYNSSDIGNIPYSFGFKQWFWIEDNISDFDYENFKVEQKDDKGLDSVKYARIYPIYKLYLYGVPSHIRNLFHSFEVTEYISFSDTNGTSFDVFPQQTKIKSDIQEQRSSLYDLDCTFIVDYSDEITACKDSDFISDPVFTGTINPAPVDCIEYNAIESVELNCIEEQEDVTILWTINY